MTLVVSCHGDPPPAEAIDRAVAALKAGDIVALPTETVYGLAADPWHTGASDRLFQLKARPRHVELPVFVSGPAQALDLCAAVPEAAVRIMEQYWPGPLTVVLPRRPDVDADLGEEDQTIGLRCPDHPVPLALCRGFGPFATTSANRHGHPPARTAAEVAEQIPGVALVLDGGPCSGEPSTVIDATGDVPKLLRPGSLSWERILEVGRG